MKKIFILIALISGLTGCASNGKKVSLYKVEDAIQFTNKLDNISSTGLDPLTFLLRKTMVKKDDYTEYKLWWCPRHKYINNAEDVSNQYGLYCKKKGGEFRKPFCHSSDDKDNILFMAKVIGSKKCQGTATAEVTVLKPKYDKHYMTKSYTSALKTFGYTTQSEKIFASIINEKRKRLSMKVIDSGNLTELYISNGCGLVVTKDKAPYRGEIRIRAVKDGAYFDKNGHINIGRKVTTDSGIGIMGGKTFHLKNILAEHVYKTKINKSGKYALFFSSKDSYCTKNVTITAMDEFDRIAFNGYEIDLKLYTPLSSDFNESQGDGGIIY